LVAEYLVRHAPASTRWALAGRDPDRLAALRERLGVDVPLLAADAADRASLHELAHRARVVVTTVGPYLRHGEPLVAACAAAGTDYADLAGEPEFVDRMYLAHHRRALETGARLVHACGFDSIPHDLGAQFTVEQLPEGAPLEVRAFVRVRGNASGGTGRSAIGAFARVRHMAAAARDRSRVEPRPAGRRVRVLRTPPYHEPAVDAWAIPFPTIDPQIVTRSARALDRYGPDFAYGHFVAIKHLPVAAAGVAGAGAALALAQLPPTRQLLECVVKAAGEGPTPQQRERSWFNVRFTGNGGDRRVVCEVAGGDPGYTETAKMLAETALCLAHDELPATAGQVTTAAAMGPVLRARLQGAGIRFDVVG